MRIRRLVVPVVVAGALMLPMSVPAQAQSISLAGVQFTARVSCSTTQGISIMTGTNAPANSYVRLWIQPYNGTWVPGNGFHDVSNWLYTFNSEWNLPDETTQWYRIWIESWQLTSTGWVSQGWPVTKYSEQDGYNTYTYDNWCYA